MLSPSIRNLCPGGDFGVDESGSTENTRFTSDLGFIQARDLWRTRPGVGVLWDYKDWHRPVLSFQPFSSFKPLENGCGLS